VSTRALDEYRAFEAQQPPATLTVLDLLAHRDVSSAIVERLGLRHESPQAVIVKDGRIRAVLNHGAIRAATLAALLVK